MVIRRALVLALVALAALPAAASAHAMLESTQPARGAQLKASPGQVMFRFDESVEASFGALRVFDSSGRPVQIGAAFHPGGRGDEVAVHLRAGLGRGAYTATYRVISADGHPVSSGFVFTVGAAAGPAQSVDQLLTGEDTGAATDTAFSVVRAVQYGALAVALGTLGFLVLCWLPAVHGAGAAWEAAIAAFTRRIRAILLVATAAGLLSGLAALVLQGAVGEGSSVWSAVKWHVIDEVLGTRFGMTWGLGAIAWALALIIVASGRPLRRAAPPDERRPGPIADGNGAGPLPPAPVGAGNGGAVSSGNGGAATAHRATAVAVAPATVSAPELAPVAARPELPVGLAVLAVPLLALAFLPALGGHGSEQPPVYLMLPANVLHVLAISAWLGGIAVLVLALRSATARLEPGDRTPLLAAVIGRFSTLAGYAIAVLLATGIAQAIVEVRTFGHLLDTAFGRAVLIKIAVAVAIIGVGYVNRQRLLPALRRAAVGTTPGRAGVLLRRTLRLELLLGATALAATGALSGYAPSIAASSGPYSGTAILGPARLEVTVDPAKVGANQLHLYLFDRRTGAPFTRTKELDVTAALPAKGVAPIPFSTHVAGPGHYVIDGATLALKGRWTFTLTDRVSDFDEYQAHFTAPIR